MSTEEFNFDESFKVIKNNMILLSTEWQFYKSFYSSEESVSILNKSASFFFSRLQLMLVDAIILKIAKLLDRKETFGKDNLSFDYLLDNIEVEEIYKKETKYYAREYRDGKIYVTKFNLKINVSSGHFTTIKYWSIKQNTLENYLEEIKNKFKKLRNYRNKNLAHLDLETALKNENHMPSDIYEIITYIIWAFDNLLNRIEVFYFNSNTCYDIIIKKGAEHLMGDLLKTMRYKEILKDGTIDNLDYVYNVERLKSV